MTGLKLWFHGLRGKLFFSAFLPVVAFALITTVAIHSTNKLGDQLHTAYTDMVPNMDALSLVAMQRARVGYFIWAALGTSDMPKARQNFIDKTKSAWTDFKKSQDYYESTPMDAEESKNYQLVKEHKKSFYDLTDSIIALSLIHI